MAFTQAPQLTQAGELGSRLADAARHAFVDGVSAVVLTAALVLAAAAVVIALRSPREGNDPDVHSDALDAHPSVDVM